MSCVESRFNTQAIRFTIDKDGKVVARAYLYILSNDLHLEPFGLLEDVFVVESHRSNGLGNQLVTQVISRAKAEGCYKLIATSRNDGTRKSVHDWYLRLGFTDYGTEFRMNF